MTTPETTGDERPASAGEAAPSAAPTPAPEPAAPPSADASAPPATAPVAGGPVPSAGDAPPPVAGAPAPLTGEASAPVANEPIATAGPSGAVILTGPVPVDGVLSVGAASDEQLAASRQVQRMTRLLVGVVLAISAVLLFQRVLEPADLAVGKPWRVSSKWIDCDPTIGRCGPHVTRIMFHTNEDESPWYEVDLGQPTSFSSVTVVNRSDHMPERAVPLIVEAGDDQQTWKELARRDETFTTWRAKFPTTTARFVRLRVARKSYLHLEAVRVHP